VVERQPGTTLAAMALHMKAMTIARRTFDFANRRAATDHAERLEAVGAIARQLESGAYPDSPWVRHATDLVLAVHMAGVTLLADRLTPGDAARALAAYSTFLETHWHLLGDVEQAAGIRGLLTTTMPELARQASDSPTA